MVAEDRREFLYGLGASPGPVAFSSLLGAEGGNRACGQEGAPSGVRRAAR